MESRELKILILEDHPVDAELMTRALKEGGIRFSAVCVETEEAFKARLDDFGPDLVLSDYNLPSYNGEAALRYVQEKYPHIPVIMVTGSLGEEAAVAFLKAGAKDYVLKDRVDRLPLAVERALAEVQCDKEHAESERLLRESEARFRNALEYAQGGIGVAAVDGRFIEVNQSMCALLGYTRPALLALSLSDIIHADDRPQLCEQLEMMLAGKTEAARLEMRCLCSQGVSVWVQVMVSLLRDGAGVPLNFIWQMEDITERKRLQDEARYLAYYDELTGLPNRRLLLDRLNQAIAYARRHQRALAVMFLDLDHFKDINDTLGHDTGDELLRVVAERLEVCVRGGDTVSRQGGDEFVIILSEVTQQLDAARVAEKILAHLNTPVVLEGQRLQITISIGIAIHPYGSTDDAGMLLKKADIAMYKAKEAGRNGYFFYGDLQEDGTREE